MYYPAFPRALVAPKRGACFPRPGSPLPFLSQPSFLLFRQFTNWNSSDPALISLLYIYRIRYLLSMVPDFGIFLVCTWWNPFLFFLAYRLDSCWSNRNSWIEGWPWKNHCFDDMNENKRFHSSWHISRLGYLHSRSRTCCFGSVPFRSSFPLLQSRIPKGRL